MIERIFPELHGGEMLDAVEKTLNDELGEGSEVLIRIQSGLFNAAYP